MALTYLTVQDVLWINFQIVGKSVPYRFADLEEATYYQYAYGQSQDVMRQANQLFTGFVKKSPFGAGNEATAFVALVAFLSLNGYDVVALDENAGDWVSKATATSPDWLMQGCQPSADDHGHSKSEVRAHLQKVLAMYPNTVKKLMASSASVA